VYILNAAALPDSRETDFDSLLPYVLARLPEEDDLLRGYEYEVVFFAGDSDGSATTKKNRPGWGWFLQAYHVLSRAMRKRLQKLYIVHEKAWVRILAEIFSTIASPKFRRKIIHGMSVVDIIYSRIMTVNHRSIASTLSNLALHIPIEDLLIPPSTYLYDRRLSDDIFAPYVSGRRAFAARQPFPLSRQGKSRLPRVLRETTNFVLLDQNIVSEGLFRVPPHAKLKEILKEAYDRSQKFIIWKDNGATLDLPKNARAQNQDEIIAEIDPKDAYSVFMAAGLIKSWYSSLRQPIFPAPTYREMKRIYGDPDDIISLERLTDLLSPSSEWSFLPAISREIMVRHLLPLLAAVANRQEQNKMTATNLAVCFAPALLCGPDQLEDAKMSSIIRRIITQAVELWDDGLREACGVAASAFSDDLQLPTDEADWEDALEGNKLGTDADADDENQVTGIILQDTESRPHQPPPLPPRSANSQQRSGSGPFSNEAVTRRKPAPPLQVPPRYSTIISENPPDVAESPVSYNEVVDGFGPPRLSPWDVPDEKKRGTNMPGNSHSPPQIVVPKRKALTAEQIDNAECAAAQIKPQRGPDGRTPLPGLAKVGIGEIPRRKAVPEDSPVENKLVDVEGIAQSEVRLNKGLSRVLQPQQAGQAGNEFRRPSWPAPAYREPSITSLARQVYPTNPNTNRRPSKSTSLPVPGPKPRTPSPALLQRMPSFETSKGPVALAPPTGPRKPNLKKASVDDLRRLYEERAGTAKTLVEAGKRR
jgi:Rho GTPase-activating protein 1